MGGLSSLKYNSLKKIVLIEEEIIFDSSQWRGGRIFWSIKDKIHGYTSNNTRTDILFSGSLTLAPFMPPGPRPRPGQLQQLDLPAIITDEDGPGTAHRMPGKLSHTLLAALLLAQSEGRLSRCSWLASEQGGTVSHWLQVVVLCVCKATDRDWSCSTFPSIVNS